MRVTSICFLLLLVFAGLPACAQQIERATLRVCVVEDGQLTEVEAAYIPPDTVMIEGGIEVQFSSIYSVADTLAYAATKGWFIDNRRLRLGETVYAKEGSLRFLPFDQLTRVSSVTGIPVFSAEDMPRPYDHLYIPVAPGCIFQPYDVYGPPIHRPDG
jgi:hypothetical protein